MSSHTSDTTKDPASFNHRLAQVNGHQYHFVDEGPKEAPLVILVHGFPESWYCWAHQIQLLSGELGLRVIAIDKPGYGETKVGKELANYSIKSTCKDLKEIVTTVIGRDQAIFIGHDWGSQVCWMMCFYFPECVESVVGISVPFIAPRAEFQGLRSVATKIPSLSYQVALAEGSIEEFDSNIREFLELFWSRSPTESEKSIIYTPFGESILKFSRENSVKKDFPSKQLMDYMVSQFQIQGCEGPTNWYRTSEINYKDASEFPTDVKINHRALLIVGKEDFLVKFIEWSVPHYTQLRTELIEGGHWIVNSNHQDVNKFLAEFLDPKNTKGKSSML